MSEIYKTSVFTRNARFLWLGALFIPPLTAFVAYQLTPHEAFWHDLLFAVLCLPIFCIWLIALFGCIISFLSYRYTARS